MATIRDVAKQSGYSVATVSRVINAKGYVSQQAEQEIRAAMAALSFSPSVTARSLAGKSSAMIALIIPDILNPFFPLLARAVEDRARECGYALILCNTDHDRQTEQDYLDMMVNKRVDGIILASYNDLDESVRSVQAKGIPLVTIDSPNSAPSAPAVYGDNREGGRQAARHLLEQGCRRLLCISGPANYDVSDERISGFCEVCEASNDDVQVSQVYGDFQEQGGYEAMCDWLMKQPDVDGVFAVNDRMAFGAWQALLDKERQVPEQVKLVGYDGIERMAWLHPQQRIFAQLTTIVQPIAAMGTDAMTRLHDLITSKEKGKGEDANAGEHPVIQVACWPTELRVGTTTQVR